MAYSPTMMTWLEPEPNGAAYVDGMNLYELEHSNPINHLDPTGELTGDENDQHGALGETVPFTMDNPPVFKGFEAQRYQEFDQLIYNLVRSFNQNKAGFAGGTADQCKNIPDLNTAIIKSWMIQESGGSPAAWAADPAQVNVPGDWAASAAAKTAIGLQQPTARNQGDVSTNLLAAIEFLVRKGFGSSGQAAGNRPQATFDGWRTALMRYNGRTVITTNGQPYNANYADRILQRAADPDHYYPIELPQPRGR